MQLPSWLTLAIGALVCVFGAYRIRLGFRSDEEDDRARARGGLFGMRRRSHLFMGIIFVLLGAGLIGASFGWSPLEGLISAPRIEPAHLGSGSGALVIPLSK